MPRWIEGHEDEMKIQEAVGKRIKAARERLKLTQDKLCRELQNEDPANSKFDARTIRRFENKGGLRWNTIEIFAKYFNISEETLADSRMSGKPHVDASSSRI